VLSDARVRDQVVEEPALGAALAYAAVLAREELSSHLGEK